MILQRIQDLKAHRHNFRWLFTASADFRRSILLIILINLVVPMIAICSALVSRSLIDAAVARNLPLLFEYAMIFGGTQLASLLLASFLPYLTALTGERISNQLQSAFLSRYYHCEWQQTSTHHTGDVLTRLTSDTRSIVSFYTHILPASVSLVGEFLVAFAILVSFDPYLALYGFILGPFAVGLSLVFGKKIKVLQKALQENESEYRAYMNESIQHLVIIKCFESYQHVQERIGRFQQKKLALTAAQSRQIISAGFISNAGFKFSFFLGFVWGAFRISQGIISFGTFAAFLQMISRIQNPILNASQLYPQFLSALTSLDRYRILESYDQEPNGTSAFSQESRLGIELSDVSFSYHPEHLVFSEASLQIQPSETIVLTGTSGIGKTTLMRLLLQLIHPESGTIRLIHAEHPDAVPTRHPLTRSAFTYVPQGNTLFSGTIAENMRIANSASAENDMQKALEIACAWEFVAELPLGIDTVIGEQGLGLSEGQSQRLCIARALLRQAPIILLDEATSALDKATEQRLIRNIKTCMPHRTCIAITHRDAVLMLADRVIDIRDARMVIQKERPA